MYNVHHRLTGKHTVDFLLVLIELFSLGVTAEALRAKTDRKSELCKWVDQHPSSTKFSHRRRCPPTIISARIVMPMNALQLCC